MYQNNALAMYQNDPPCPFVCTKTTPLSNHAPKRTLCAEVYQNDVFPKEEDGDDTQVGADSRTFSTVRCRETLIASWEEQEREGFFPLGGYYNLFLCEKYSCCACGSVHSASFPFSFPTKMHDGSIKNLFPQSQQGNISAKRVNAKGMERIIFSERSGNPSQR